jgi:hypothetical protein
MLYPASQVTKSDRVIMYVWIISSQTDIDEKSLA